MPRVGIIVDRRSIINGNFSMLESLYYKPQDNYYIICNYIAITIYQPMIYVQQLILDLEYVYMVTTHLISCTTMVVPVNCLVCNLLNTFLNSCNCEIITKV
jgi:hypothetical protein